MLKFIHYIDEAGGKININAVNKPSNNFKSIRDAMQKAYKQEQAVTKAIHIIAEAAVNAKDFGNQSFLQWFIDEQVEEEGLFRGILDKIELIGEEGRGLFLIDEFLKEISLEEH